MARGERDVRDAQRQAAEIAKEQEDIKRDAKGSSTGRPDLHAEGAHARPAQGFAREQGRQLEKQLDRMVGERRANRATPPASCPRRPRASATTRSRKRSATRRACWIGRARTYARNFRGRDRRQHRSTAQEARRSRECRGQTAPRSISGDALDKARDHARGGLHGAKNARTRTTTPRSASKAEEQRANKVRKEKKARGAE